MTALLSLLLCFLSSFSTCSWKKKNAPGAQGSFTETPALCSGWECVAAQAVLGPDRQFLSVYSKSSPMLTPPRIQFNVVTETTEIRNQPEGGRCYQGRGGRGGWTGKDAVGKSWGGRLPLRCGPCRSPLCGAGTGRGGKEAVHAQHYQRTPEKVGGEVGKHEDP